MPKDNFFLGHPISTTKKEENSKKIVDQYEIAMFSSNYGLSRQFCLSANGHTDGRTDGRTDGPSYRDARTHLKMMGGGW